MTSACSTLNLCMFYVQYIIYLCTIEIKPIVLLYPVFILYTLNITNCTKTLLNIKEPFTHSLQIAFALNFSYNLYVLRQRFGLSYPSFSLLRWCYLNRLLELFYLCHHYFKRILTKRSLCLLTAYPCTFIFYLILWARLDFNIPEENID